MTATKLLSITIQGTGQSIALGGTVTGLSGTSGQVDFWTVEVPAGTPQLYVSIGGGVGNPYYLVVGQSNYPSSKNSSTYSCIDYSGNVCVINNPAAGTWKIALEASSSSYSYYSGKTLTVNP